jgi:hypothetical protein
VNAKPANVNKAAAGVNKSGRKPNTCGKCGARGYTAQGCGRTHNVKSKPKADDEEEEESGDGRSSTTPLRPPVEARRPLPEKPAPFRHRPIAKPLDDRAPEPDDDDEPDDKTPFELAPAIAARSRCPHGNDAGRCSQCIGAAVRRVAIVAGAVLVDGQVLHSTREHELAARPASATRGAHVQRARKARGEKLKAA